MALPDNPKSRHVAPVIAGEQGVRGVVRRAPRWSCGVAGPRDRGPADAGFMIGLR